MIPRHGQRDDNADKGLQLAGAEIFRRFQQRAIQFLNAGVERHHHKRQQDVHQADDHRRGG